MQQNYRKEYEYTIFILKTSLCFNILMIYIQEPFLGN